MTVKTSVLITTPKVCEHCQLASTVDVLDIDIANPTTLIE